MSLPVDIDQLVYSRVHPDPSITVRDLEAASAATQAAADAGDAARLAGQMERAIGWFTQAITSCPVPEGVVDLLLDRAECFMASADAGDGTQAAAQAERDATAAIEHAARICAARYGDAAEPPVEARALAVRARAFCAQGRVLEARADAACIVACEHDAEEVAAAQHLLQRMAHMPPRSGVGLL